MQYRSGAARFAAASGSHIDDWSAETPVARDWKKLFLVFGLGALSWVATYVGMLELIEANMGELPLVHKVIIAFSVGMLMTMIIWLLDQLFAPVGFVTKVLYAFGYVFLTVISAGFGFGFYWKVLESRSEASRSAEGAVSQVQGSLYAASTRLDQLQQTLDSLTLISKQKADNERATGTSCPASKAGDGPRRKMREDDAARFSFASDFVKGRAVQVKTEIGALDVELAKISKDDKSIIDAKTGTRNEFMKTLGRKLDNTVTGFNAFRTDPQLKQIRSDLAERADKSSFPDTRGGTYQCPDSQLTGALKGVVRAIDGLPEVEKPKIATVEGSEATIEAFRRLTASFIGLVTLKMPPSADEQRELQKKAVQSVENPQAAARLAASIDAQAGLSKRDYVPLAVAVFVDLCLLLVSMGRPINRLGGMVPRMRAAERGPVIQILSRFSEIHRDEKMRESFEVLRHVVFDYAGVYYVAVPLDAPYTETRTEQVVDQRTRRARLVKKEFTLNPAKREAMRVEAHLIGNLFASFEKDRVFKRVMWINTPAARRQLQRQGSKFANSEAFRIYRFTDGAWSEIILGAVMGAARRVEQHRAETGQVGERREPSLDSLADRMRQAEAETVPERDLPRPKRGYAPRQEPPAAVSELEPETGHMTDAELTARFGPYARRARAAGIGPHDPANSNTPTQSRSSPFVAEHAAGVDADTGNEHSGNGAPGNGDPGNGDPGNVVPFKPASETADTGGNMRMPNIIARGQTEVAARLDPDPRDVTVTATERRFSFSLPMHDPRIDRGLYGVSSALLRAAAVPQAAPAREAMAGSQPDETTIDRAQSTATATAVVPRAGSEWPTALTLPGPTMEHEHRG